MDLVITTEKPSQLTIVEGVKAQLRESISKWTKNNPHRYLMLVPVHTLKQIPRGDFATQLAVYTQLEGYIGAEVHTELHPIPCRYELHAAIMSGTIEVLLLRPELEKFPLRYLTKEVALLAHEWSRSYDIDEVFEFNVPMSALSYIDRLSSSRRSRFSTQLEPLLNTHGLSIHGGKVTSGLQIRRNR